MIICMLGRQPRLGLAELESLFGSDKLQPLGTEAALLTIDPSQIDQAKLGGTIKIARLLTTLTTTNWRTITDKLVDFVPQHVTSLPEGKLTLGISAHNIQTKPQYVGQTALQLKKIIRSSGRPVRIVPNTELSLNSAQVWHNRLTSEHGLELIALADKGKTYIAQTITVQDVDSYSLRDFSRPKRDAFVGMLPPKLAQIMLNLAHPAPNATVLDPFCGTGVVLMEAALQGYTVEGSDISQKMIDYTQANLDWLGATYHMQPKIAALTVADATNHTWGEDLESVVCETYLGQPYNTLPRPEILKKNIDTCNLIISKFLQNLAPQLGPNAQICIGVPAWRSQNRFLHLPLIDDLEKIGYNRVSFSCASMNDLLYHRPDQIVARELLVLTPKNRKK